MVLEVLDANWTSILVQEPEKEQEVIILTNDDVGDSWRFFEQHRAKYTDKGWMLLDDDIERFEVIGWRIS